MSDTLISQPREREGRERHEAEGGSRGARRPWQLGLLPGSLLAALISVAAAAWALHLWRANLGVPWRYAPIDDTKFYLMLVKGIIDHGWFQSNASLGAPFGQQLYDFPQGADNLNLLLIRVLSLGSSNPAVVANLFYLATFALAAGCAFAVLRALGLLAAPALVASVLFSLLTYHFFRGESHLLLSAYYAVPLSCYLFLCLLDGDPLFARRAAGSSLSRWASRRTLITVALCVVIGSESLYYATFAEVLLVAATVFAVVLRRRAAALGGVLACALIAVTLGLNLAPSVVYRLRHGDNPAVARTAVQDENHGLKITNLVVPAPGDRIAVLRQISARYDNAVSPGYCEACFDDLGAVGTVGLGWLGLCGLVALVGGASWFGARRLFRHSGVGVAIALAVASIGGLSSLVEFFVTPNIRGWNRMSVFIAFFALLAVAGLLDALVRGARGRGGAYALWPLAVLAVGVFGVYEQTTDYFVPGYATDAAEYHSDGALVAQIQHRLPIGAAIFELPYVPFPEGYPMTEDPEPVGPFDLSYELTRGYIQSSTLRWSYGAMKGRPADWSAQLADEPLSAVLPAVAAAGFDGLWVDPNGYGNRAPAIRSALIARLGEQPLVSRAGDLWFFDLRAYDARLLRESGAARVTALRHATLWPLRAGCTAAGLRLANPSPGVRTATLGLRLIEVSGHAPVRVRLTYPDATTVTVAVGRAGARVSRALHVAGGASAVGVATVAGAGTVQLSGAVLSDEALRPFVGRPRAKGSAAGDPLAGLAEPPCQLR